MDEWKDRWIFVTTEIIWMKGTDIDYNLPLILVLRFRGIFSTTTKAKSWQRLVLYCARAAGTVQTRHRVPDNWGN